MAKAVLKSDRVRARQKKVARKMGASKKAAERVTTGVSIRRRG
jgi:hypothetical protein